MVNQDIMLANAAPEAVVEVVKQEDDLAIVLKNVTSVTAMDILPENAELKLIGAINAMN